MKSLLVLFFLSLGCQDQVKSEEKPVNYILASTEFIEASLKGQAVDNYISVFEYANLNQLSNQLGSDEQKITFWVNIYNGYILYFLRGNPELYQDRRNFFKKERIKIGSELLSFEDIEHGLLRRSQHPWLFGYGRKWFPSSFEKKFRVSQVDYRIHFVLNCGAKSCPPVRVLDINYINNQLSKATKSYLTTQSNVEISKKTVTTTPLFSWFRGDFGGKKGIKKILVTTLELNESDFNVQYKEYDWTLELSNFIIGEEK